MTKIAVLLFLKKSNCFLFKCNIKRYALHCLIDRNYSESIYFYVCLCKLSYPKLNAYKFLE